MRLALIIVSLFVFTLAHAETVTCPIKVEAAMIGEGPASKVVPGTKSTEIRYFVEQDIGGDYDEDAPQREWNELNMNKDTKTILHCYAHRGDKTGVDIVVPSNIKRCISTPDNNIVCSSGTVSCQNYVGDVMLEAISKYGGHRRLRPDINEDKKKIWSSLKVEEEEKIYANCFPIVETSWGDFDYMPVPDNMKSCVFEDRRFICSAE